MPGQLSIYSFLNKCLEISPGKYFIIILRVIFFILLIKLI